jgi:prophage tail gpP-like protein
MLLDVTLQVDNQLFGGWKSVRIARSIESVSGFFELSVTDRWPLQNARRDILPGDACTVSVGDTVLITGYVDDVDVEYSGDDHSITVRGRDKTADIIDCAAHYQTGSFSHLGLLDIATRLCAPHGVRVKSNVDLGAVFRTHAITPGETIYETLELLARRRGVLLMPQTGDLLFTQPGNTRLNTVLKSGKNILTGSVQRSVRERFARYTVYGQSQGFDDAAGDFAAGATGEATDNAVRGSRHHVIVAEGAANDVDCEKRAQWARNTAVGRSQRAVYTVQGWTYNATTDVWPINVLVPVEDDIANVQRDLLIVSAAFVKDERGTITELTLSPREAYDTLALPDPDTTDGFGLQ